MAIVNELAANRDTFRLRAYSCCRPTRKGIKLLRFHRRCFIGGGGERELRFPTLLLHAISALLPRNVVRFSLFSFSPLIKRRQREKFCSQPKRKSFSVDRIVNVYRLYVRAGFRFRVITSRNNNLDLILIWIMKLCELIGHV